MAGIKIVDLPPLGRDLASTDLLELSLAGGTGSRKITGQEIMNTSKLNIGTTAITSGTVGRVLFEGTGNVVQQSSNLFWDNTNGRLGVGTSSTSGRLSVLGTSTTVPNNATWISAGNPIASLFGEGIGGNMDLFIGGASSVSSARPVLTGRKSAGTLASPTALSNGDNIFSFLSGGYSGTSFVNTGSINMIVDGVVSSGTVPQAITFETGTSSRAERLRIGSNGNVLINTTTDAGFKLDVNGTARVTGTFSLGADTARIDLWRSSGAGGGRIGTGYTNPSVNHVYITCDTNSRAIVIDDSNRTVFASSLGTSTVASAQVAVVSSTRGFLPPVMTTTQKNAIATPAAGLEVFDSTTLTPSIYNGTNWQNILVPNSNGNVLINTTTDAGFKLDVNGTARVQTNLIVSATNPTAQIAGAVSFSSRISGNLNGAISGQAIASVLVDESAYSGTGSSIIRYAVYAGSSYFDTLNVGVTATTYVGSNVIFNASTPTLRLMGYNALTGGSGNGSGTLLLTDRTSGTMLGMSATYGGGGSRLTIFNQYSDGPTSRIKINMSGVDTACFFADGSLQIGNGETTIASAILSASSTTRGFLPPRMTQTQRNAIASPAIGLEIYQTDATEGKYIYKSSGWTYIG